MSRISTKMKLALVAVAYAAVLAFAANEFYEQYLFEHQHAAEVAAASGMYAGGEMLLEFFVAILFMIPTFFLVRIGSKFEDPYTTYSKTLLALGLSAPVCLGLLFLGSQNLPEKIVSFCLLRLYWSPFILALIGMSRLMSRFDRVKRLTSYALLSEGGTLCLSIAMIVYSVVTKTAPD